MVFFTFVGAFGLLLVSFGVITKGRSDQNLLFIFGGLFLEIYSIWIGNLIFIVLQMVFILAAVYDYFWRK